MRSMFAKVLSSAALLVASAPAWAQPRPLPEPGMLELLALGGVVAGVIAFRNRRK